ncbi:Retrovirus-related Pol polyprotein from type-1 retrotransposable element R1 [Eumeta japonica]|uniref:Retrovirus-related Pol polyprotein from type-1 retrotransposable element R1 n=1 Tax=Eumeta variegata TaxID=151549 RepID=A0A4C1W0E5_EUMVA|nr:Retrovirus-related Pol polyprotein from type-1 retrotransposable element R1 [Eumeta japonica]
MGYQRDREVVVCYAGGQSRKMISKGCIQGSIAGLTFWNHVLNSLLQELGDLGVYVQAYAVTCQATWGLSPEIVRTIYFAVIEPIVMCVSYAWAPAASKIGVRKMLDALRSRSRLFWVRAHTGTAGNERADELVRNASLKKKTTADYDRFPLSFANSVIMAVSLKEWQKRYAEGNTGEITKCFFPRVKEAYGILSRVRMTPLLAQTFMGHGEFAQYLHRFKLPNSPYCACAPDRIQDLLHVLEECPIFLKERAESEVDTSVRILRDNFPDLLSKDEKRKYL